VAPADPPEMEIPMPGSNLRRSVLCVLFILLLLPLATAYAAPAASAVPAKPSEHVQSIRLSELGRGLLQSFDAVLSMLRSATVTGTTIVPPGGGSGSTSGEGNGLDPHGKP